MSYFNPKMEMRDTGDPQRGKGLFAREKILKGELIEDYDGETQTLSKQEVAELPQQWQDWCWEVDDGHEFCPRDFLNPAMGWSMNHSCDPNVGSLGGDVYRHVAMCDIEAGEEITYDYAMTDSSGHGFQCSCGKPNCRKIITGNDWMIPELQERCQGYFQKNIQEKIDALHKQEILSPKSEP